MPDIKFRAPDGSSLSLPDFLFYTPKAKSKSTPPHAIFDPSTALSGDAWHSSTTPSSKPEKRSIIIDNSSFPDLPPVADFLAFVTFLKDAGFEIYLRIEGPEPFLKVEDDLTNFGNALRDVELKKFNPEKDYTKIKVARDKLVFLDRSKKLKIYECQKSNSSFNEWSFIAKKFTKDGIFEYFDLNFYSNTLASNFLSYCTEEEAEEFITKYTDLVARSPSESFYKTPRRLKFFIKTLSADTAPCIHSNYSLPKKILELLSKETADKNLVKFITKNIGIFKNSEWLHPIIKKLPKADVKKIVDAAVSNIGEDDFRRFKKISLLLLISNEKETAELIDKIKKGSPPDVDNLRDFILCLKNAPKQNFSELFEFSMRDGIRICYSEILKDFPEHSREIIESSLSANTLYLDYSSFFLENAPIDLKEKVLQKLVETFRNNPHGFFQSNGFSQSRKIPPLDLSKKYDRLLFSELKKIISDIPIEDISYLPHRFQVFPEKAESFLRDEGLIRRCFLGDKTPLSLPENYAKPLLQILLKSDARLLSRKDYALESFAKPDLSSMLSSFRPAKLPTALPNFAINPTHFQIAKLDADGLATLETWKEHFSKVAVLNIFEIDEGMADELSKSDVLRNLFPKLRHLVLPKTFPREKIPAGYSYEFSDYEKDAPYRAVTTPARNDLFISSGAVEKEMTTSSSEKQTYEERKAGEILNPGATSDMSIRTCIIKRDILTSLDQREYVPEKFETVTLAHEQILTERQIAELKARGPEKTFYRFNLHLTAGKKTRLLSASASEKLVGIITDNDAEIEIEKGDDDFFYVTAKEDCSFSHVVAVDAIARELPAGSVARRIIDEYKSPPYAEVASATSIRTPDYGSMTHETWLEEVFTKKLGSCRHRVAAVEYKLRKAGIEKENLRVTTINGKHVVLEVREKGIWHKVDLGGASGAKITKLDDNYKPPELDTSPAPTVASTHHSAPTASPEILAATTMGAAPTSERHSKHMRHAFAKLSTMQQVENEEDLKVKIGENKKVLIVTNNIESHANHLLEKARTEGRKIFYIDSPAKIDIAIKNLFLPTDGDPMIRSEGLLEDFLDGGEEERKGAAADQPPLLIINWDAFAPSERVALNSLLDERDCRIHEKKIPDQTQIISLCSSASKDLSFLSRHDLSLSSDISFAQKSEISKSEIVEIDLQGFPDWRSYFFGRVVLNDEKMEWEKSKFVEALESGSENFIIKNISNKAAEELAYELAQAKALGYFEYHGHKIPLPKNFTLDCKETAFDFSRFIVSIKSNVTSDKAPKDCVLINGYLFDQLLQRTEVIDGKYREIPGLIRENSNKILKIFISENLSESQWYCLLNQADGDTGLRIYLAPDVKIPDGINLHEIEEEVGEEESKASADPSKPKIVVSSNAGETVHSLAATDVYYAIIDVEDYSYQDLIGGTNFDLVGNNFRNFSKNKSQFLERLEAGEKIILKGKFAPDLLQMLHPLLIAAYPNLTVIIEDESLTPPSFLAAKNCEIRAEEETKKSPARDHHETLDRSKFDDDSKRKSDEFIAARKSKFAEMIADSNLLQLVGHSGVGKSRLMKMFEEEGKFKIHREMKNFEEWAKNDGDGKVKILFIDESNIEDTHFTTFSPLKAGGNRRILYQGKFYDLDETHKVVFACNPKEYGGGRLDQKLFEDESIPQMHLQDFPAAYIYEKILKESIYDKLADEVKKEIPEKKFRKNCRDLIANYQALNEANKSATEALTVRELQEQALESLLEKQELKKIKSKNFTSTEATKDAELALDSMLRIREKQREGKFPNHTVGINGILFEGDSGTGKSEMIRARLEAHGITYRKINAKTSLEEKTKIILDAFEKGETVWIDELNSCIDDGLEKILNAVLTGINPETGKEADKPGFALVASINQISDEGRSKISPALMHRLHHHKMKTLREYSRDDLAEIVGSWVGEKSAAEEIAEDFCKLLAEWGGAAPNLRMLRTVCGGMIPSVDVVGAIIADQQRADTQVRPYGM